VSIVSSPARHDGIAVGGIEEEEGRVSFFEPTGRGSSSGRAKHGGTPAIGQRPEATSQGTPHYSIDRVFPARSRSHRPASRSHLPPPPPASGVSSSFHAPSSDERTTHAPHRRRAFWGATRDGRTPLAEGREPSVAWPSIALAKSRTHALATLAALSHFLSNELSIQYR